jgi:hypothetical protein
VASSVVLIRNCELWASLTSTVDVLDISLQIASGRSTHGVEASVIEFITVRVIWAVQAVSFDIKDLSFSWLASNTGLTILRPVSVIPTFWWWFNSTFTGAVTAAFFIST